MRGRREWVSQPSPDRGGEGRLRTWRCVSPGLPLQAWLESHAVTVREALQESGAVCLREFAPLIPRSFKETVALITGMTLKYVERSTPRRNVGAEADDIYTSTDYPADLEIFLHNENSYAARWPAYLHFYCAQPATTGGATTLADIREVESGIDKQIRARLIARGLIHRRVFADGVSLPWQTVFGVRTREALREFCTREGHTLIEEDRRLAVDYLHSPYVRHMRSGEACWFNHAAFFQPQSLDSPTREALGKILGEGILPNNMLYGDGEPIETEVIEHLRAAYRRAAFQHDWQPNDLLILDNMRFAHGRAPFSGERAIWLAMSGQLERRNLSIPDAGNRQAQR